MVDKPMTFTMHDLVTKFETVTLLCTLVCAGNRRKEQNMITKTKGFNWGASGTGTGDALLHVIAWAFKACDIMTVPTSRCTHITTRNTA